MMETWTRKLKYSFEGTQTGNTSFDLQCPPIGSFEPLNQEDHLDCIVRYSVAEIPVERLLCAISFPRRIATDPLRKHFLAEPWHH